MREERSDADAGASDAAETEPPAKRTRGGDSRAREFFVVRNDVNKFGPTPRCPGCADVTKGISAQHAHNDECRIRITKLWIDGAQRVESYFDRTRVREETSPGGTGLSSGSATVVTDAQTAKRKAEETVETDERTKKRQTAGRNTRAHSACRMILWFRGSRTQCQPHADRAKSSGATRGAAGQEKLH